MKIVAIVQARMGSSRLPGKVMKPVANQPMIGVLLNRLSRSKRIDQITVATSTNPENLPLRDYVDSLGFTIICGSENNVLSRFALAAKSCDADIAIRITGDCPLVDPQLVDQLIDEFIAQPCDYLSNTLSPTYPDGLDIEIMSSQALSRAENEAVEKFDQEHVTPYLYRSGNFETRSYEGSTDYSSLRWTVDEPADYEVIQKVFTHFEPDIHFSWRDVLVLQKSQPEIFSANQSINRNEGSTLNQGQSMWARARRVIPGGNLLLSKRPEMFLPEQWPAYFSQSKGCHITDLDGNEYIDMSIMGIGTNLLGYGNAQVDEAVMRCVQQGNMSTLNCPEEVLLAERLVHMHPWSDMARFARTGGEANAVAIRIARAASGREGVAICGYHGWHDWYLSANIRDEDNLGQHLLTGLPANGVPKSLAGTVHPFQYNDLEALKDIVSAHSIGVIKMEVQRSSPPAPGFLEAVRQLADTNNIVLIFDECTSGFRQTFGGLHLKYGVEPDMALFGKALGNGYAITATIGRKAIMEAAQSTFISSTFWTERIGPTAALACLDVMENKKSWETVTNTGLDVKAAWQRLADEFELEIQHNGLPALAGFGFTSPNALAYKTLISQEMLKLGYLAGTALYVCTEHSPEIVEKYIDNLRPIFALIKECEEGRDISELLEGPICHDGFKRLN